MNQEEIKKILPHRDNMLLVEESEVVDAYIVEREKSAPERARNTPTKTYPIGEMKYARNSRL